MMQGAKAASSRFACKYAGLEVFVGLRKLRSNEAIRGIIWGQKHLDIWFVFINIDKFI